MTPAIPDLQGRLAIDAQALGALRAQAKQSPGAALEKAATQFEALFLQMLLKSMRESVPQDGLFDNETTRTYIGMLDQQFAAGLSGKGKLGLADMLVKQLRAAGAAGAASAEPGSAPTEYSPLSTGPRQPPNQAIAPGNPVPMQQFNPFESRDSHGPNPSSGVAGAKESALSPRMREFVDKIGPHALAASRETGIPARFIVAQAALESGWGRSEIRAADGAPSYNLFGIKAGRGWSGNTVDTATTEYVNGAMVKTTEKFRAYGSYAEAFQDYARLLRSSGRYSEALASGDDPFKFAQGLQKGGYATDPRYAEKIARVIQSTFSVKA
ncbi:MAG: flagellar assembly peptidoglycan hydrolase FlgJ [Betaproteobacteria bacterium]|nr:flagellar assembly peptidoglycan hydrolase FlgJ [Betaproteobacteria bacterium]